MPRRYTLRNFLRALRDPKRLVEEGRRLVDDPRVLAREAARVRNGVLSGATRRLFRMRHGDGIDVMARDWDNLLLLDACRYDYFAEVNTLDGDLTRVVSRGTKSWEFMEGNFVGRELHDTVYVTANPHAVELEDGTFHATEVLLDRWTEDPGTVLPGEVAEAAAAARDRYPNKRLIVHFMQPHAPFLGPTADAIRDEIDLRGFHLHQEESPDLPSIYDAARRGVVGRDRVRRAYRESLGIVLDHVASLLDGLAGKTVVSSDHGELLGDPVVPFVGPTYGHPMVYTADLYAVPWLEIGAEERPTITAEPPVGTAGTVDDGTVEDRLRALGYRAGD